MKRLLVLLALSLGACQSGTVTPASVLASGQLFCAYETALGPLTVALANDAGVGVTVIGQSSKAVADACALINAIPVMPPANPAQAPVKATATTLPPVSVVAAK